MRGVVLDALNEHGSPSVTELRKLASGPNVGHRLTIFNHPTYFTYQRRLARAGFWTAGVLTGESFQNDPGVSRAEVTRRIYGNRRLTLPDVNIIGNEWNVHTYHVAAYPYGDTEMVAYWNEVVPVIKELHPNAVCYLGELFSEPEDPTDEILRIWGQLNPKPDGVGYHPYFDSFEQGIARLARLKQTFRVGVSAFEWNSQEPDVVERFDRALAGVTDHRNYFCYSDGMVADHGLRTVEGLYKDSYHALRRSYRHG